MVLQARGKLVFRKQRMKRRDGSEKIDVKAFIYIPTTLWRDSQWPFKLETQDVHIAVDTAQDLIIMQATEEKASNKLGRGE